jgi:hypothetical protein
MEKNRRGGAPKGNLNASRNGPYSWKLGRMLPAEKDHVGKLVRHEEEAILADLGGVENTTAMQRGIVSDTGMALGLVLLAFEEAAAKGSISTTDDGKWDFMPGLQKVKGLLGTRRQNLLALGLERRAKDVDKTVIVRRWSGTDPAQVPNTAFPASDAKQEQK